MSKYNAHHSNTIALSVSFGAASVLAVVLRFVARSRTKIHYAADDWLALAGVLTLLSWMGVLIYVSENGAGYNLAIIPKPVLVRYLKGIYVGGILAPVPLTLAKLSVLYLYRRLFKCDRRLRITVNVVGVLCILWFIAAAVGVAFKCVPIEKSWNPQLPGTCYSLQVFVVAIECPNSLIDFVMVALPVRVIKSLQLPLQRKILICIVFILGGLVAIIGFIRIALVYRKDAISLKLLGDWLLVQLSIAVICACLPTYGPLLTHGALLSKRLKVWYSSVGSLIRRRHISQSSGSELPPSLDSNPAKRYHEKIHDNLNDVGDKSVLTSVVGVGNYAYDHEGTNQEGTERDYMANVINIRQEIELV